jgi:IPT/TIG domain
MVGQNFIHSACLPTAVSLGAAAVLWLVYGVCCSWNPMQLVEGADGRPSTSKFQFWLWTIVIIPTFCGLYAIRLVAHGPAVDGYWPRNLLIVMGMSVATTAAAKGITVGYIASDRLVKTSVPSGSKWTLTTIMQDDQGFPDLSKVQMLAWTLIAVVIYIAAVVQKFNAFDWKLPDIDNSLMVLMGLGHGAYLGKKLTSQNVPSLTSLTSNTAPLVSLPVDVTIVGTSFGDAQGNSLISFDGSPAAVIVKSWSATQVKFTFPATQASGGAWNKGQTVLVGLLIEGEDSDNSLPFSIT